MQKLLIICGPTSTGKSALGISLAKKFNGEIISADSRQVYKGMSIGTGKEYSSQIPIWGYDLVSPNEQFSVSHFVKYADQKIKEIVSRNKLPILVGGTGLYIKAAVDQIETISVPPSIKLRKKYKDYSSNELFEELKKLDKDKALLLNKSDRQNPRRLVRAIEISLSNIKAVDKPAYNTLFIGLTSSLPNLYKRIDESVDRRVRNGFQEEVKELIRKGISQQDPSMSATGYREMMEYIEGKIDYDNLLIEWAHSEKNYVKRQLTWFKNDKRINWFDISKKNTTSKVAELVNSWNNRQE